ncbi:chloride channel protein [Sphingobacterium faecale]|uniref:Chloride channel protein n=1 Tax=Sphingobacterium faecale TaxID=2803775 RepID=A0ABS1R247_9SPHI|nr:chloride channel protein [Sphingobacterium faecale]MBL1408767.1 chloride channel protein [Sphingobacterium faecale]
MRNSKFASLIGLPWYSWLKIGISIAVFTGITSVVFLNALNYVGDLREQRQFLLLGLPVAGLLIVFLYQRYGGVASKGNNLLFEEYYNPKGNIPLLMAPLVIVATLLTHLFGGSAGREGTAVQYGGTYADFIAKKMGLNKTQTRITLICGIAAGFTSLFGTPLAGVVFSVELFRLGKLRYKAIIPALLTAYLSHGVCLLLQAPHTHYPFLDFQLFQIQDIHWVILFAILAGVVARFFTYTGDMLSHLFKRIDNPYWRVVIGSLVILAIIAYIGNTKYIGLGIPTILESFEQPQSGIDFLAKIVLTCLTLSVGFKGGEVTPLFFIGATFASFLSIYIPLPLLVITGLGFVSVFSGSTKTPFACAIMAAELFGIYILPFALLSTLIAAFVSGQKGIYSSQKNRKMIKQG